MQIHLNSEIICNSIILISSLSSAEQGSSGRIAENLRDLSQGLNFNFISEDISSKAELVKMLKNLAYRSRYENLRAFINFYMHGCKKNGLHISKTNEYVSWDILVRYLRLININMGNNLGVVGSACYGLNAIAPIKLDRPTPFFLLLAPEEEVELGFIEDNLPKFYRELFHNGVQISFDNHLRAKFKYFHCEKLLFIALRRYINAACKGKNYNKRIETLLSDCFANGIPKTENNLRGLRKIIKEFAKPNQALIDRYTKTFLLNKRCSFNIKQLLDT